MTNMETTTAKWTEWAASLPCWLTGPIFDKEMRVSSRRRRSYVLRFVYIGLFTFLVAVQWLDQTAPTASGTPSVYQVSRMASVGRTIVMAILWFQFLAAQLIAVVMLSTSISDEIYKRTLGTLMTTPIRSFQIVVGKLASRLLQIVLLLAISLPMLAVVRVFGGVPWDYLLCGLCVTMTAVVFVGSLSLFFSIFTRRAYAAILETILTLGLLFLLVPLLVALLWDARSGPPVRVQAVLTYLNPYITMGMASVTASVPRMPFAFFWPIHCAIMLGASALLLLLAMICVRRAALRQAVGLVAEAGRRQTPSGRRRGLLAWLAGRPSADICRVVGPPVLWKERRIPLLGKRRTVQFLAGVLCAILLALTYGVCARERQLREPAVHVVYAAVFLGVGLLFTTVLPATAITTERESQTWMLLLTTTVGRWELLWSKFAGAVRRCGPAWVLLFGHVLAFVAAGIIHPIVLAQVAILVAGMLVFLTGTGLYFSTRLRHTTTAVIANMALAAGLWALVPLGLGIVLSLAKLSDRVLKVYMDFNPFVQAGVVTTAVVYKRTGGSYHGPGKYEWLQGAMNSMVDATGWMALTCAVYAALGLVFLTLAAVRLRREP